MPQILRHQGANGEVVLDDRYFPIAIAVWHGEVCDELVDAYYHWHDGLSDQAMSEERKLVSVSDVSRLHGLGGKIRRRFIDETNARSEAFIKSVDSVLLVTQGPFIQGIFASIVYRLGWSGTMVSFKTLPDPLERALVRLDNNGIKPFPPLEPSKYATGIMSEYVK